MNQTIFSLTFLVSVILTPVPPQVGVNAGTPVIKTLITEKHLDLTTRERNSQINQGFADNILLALHYLKGESFSQKVDWEKIREPFAVSFTLLPGEVFAFHGNVLPEFTPPEGEPKITMNSRFFTDEGYKSVASLGGNGVCHLASLINWAAQDAGLEVTARANHNFAPVPGVPREHGTSIKSQSPNQNLYVKNNKGSSVVFEFTAEINRIDLRIISLNQ